MPDEIVFYTNPMSRGRTVRWMLEELGCPYRTELVEYGPAMKSPAFLAINPMGKVPALTRGGTVVTETAAICTYLADAFPAAGLAPAPDSPLRADYYRWLFFGAGPMEMACINGANGLAMPEGKERMAGYGTLALTLDTLEAAIGSRPHLVGDGFTTADLFIAALLGWTMAIGVVDRRPAFERYAAPILARPAAARAKAIDEAVMPARP